MTHTSSLAIGPRVLVAVATYKRVDLLNELLASLNIGIATGIVGEVLSYRCSTRCDLVAEQINLVQEEDQRRLFEVLAVGDLLLLTCGRAAARVRLVVTGRNPSVSCSEPGTIRAPQLAPRPTRPSHALDY